MKTVSGKIFSCALSAVIASGVLSAFPAAAYAKINMNDLPEPLSSDSRSAEVLRFKRSKPAVTVNEDNRYYRSDRGARLSWKPISSALMYEIYYKPENAEKFELYKTILDTEIWVDAETDTQFKVRAVTYNYDDNVVNGPFSKAITIKIPDPRTGKGRRSNDDPDSYNDWYDGDEGYYIEEEYEKICFEPAPAPAAPVAADSTAARILPEYDYDIYDIGYNTEEYGHDEESGFKSAAANPLSTFSADVDTASYANIRRLINDNSYIPEDAVRIEEMLNYFDYGIPAPADGSPFSIYTELSDCPWNKDSKLLMLSLAGKEIPEEEEPASNLVFLVDVSGSMSSDDKLPLVKECIKSLAGTMSSEDKISIVTYSGTERVILAGANGNQINTVSALTELLDAGGSTNGESGIIAAYELAEKYMTEGGNNRIILATDGDLNVGISDEDELKELIEQKRRSGVYFSVMGFGTGNIKDNKMETLADNGNGSYHYIDTELEAEKVLYEERSGTLYTIADDVKIQVEFNPETVKGYRLIGYDNRRLNAEDFENDKKDAGEVGAGHSVTVLYEIITSDSKTELPASDLKYKGRSNTQSGELLTVSVRYKNPGENKSELISKAVKSSDYSSAMSGRMTFACAVAEFGLMLKDSEYKGSASYEQVLALTDKSGKTYMGGKYEKEFRSLVKKYINSFDVYENDEE